MNSLVTVGIDLGTTNSLCAVFQDGQPKLVPNAHGGVLTPSVVGVMENGQLLVGSPAKELRVTQPERCASTFKRYMGTDRRITLAGRSMTAPELSAVVLKSLKADAEAYLKCEVRDAVITVPAYFNDHQRKATRLAGELAGFHVRRIINEPTAAALTYGFHDRGSERKLLVIDLGGGTFDVTLMDVFEGTLEISATAGESSLGGEDFTDRMVGELLSQQKLQLEMAELHHPLMVSRLRQQCETAKRELAQKDSVTIRIPARDGTLPEKAVLCTLTSAQFEQLAGPLMERLQRPVGRVLRDAQLNPGQVDSVILVGGATRMPVVRKFVTEFFSREPLCEHNPDEVVALGAAIQAALMNNDAAVDDLVMTDVCPFTLGVETARELGPRIVDGYFAPVIHRNTTIPVSREESFSTLHPNQSEVLLKVYQGESRRTKDNVLLGELRVTGIPPGPAGQAIFVRFTYDLNGILEVEALVEGTGRKQRCVITSSSGSLTPAQIAEAVQKMQALKFCPRDDVANQRLLHFAERMAGEISTSQRDQLELALQIYEQALHSSDREAFERAQQTLLLTLSALGIQYNEQSDE